MNRLKTMHLFCIHWHKKQSFRKYRYNTFWHEPLDNMIMIFAVYMYLLILTSVIYVLYPFYKNIISLKRTKENTYVEDTILQVWYL
jgi:hypothetical protein